MKKRMRAASLLLAVALSGATLVSSSGANATEADTTLAVQHTHIYSVDGIVCDHYCTPEELCC